MAEKLIALTMFAAAGLLSLVYAWAFGAVTDHWWGLPLGFGTGVAIAGLGLLAVTLVTGHG